MADNATGLSYGVVRSRSGLDSAPRSGAVTVSLALDYTASAKIGQWLQITPRVLKAGRSLGFVDALVTADGDVVARANATFRLVE